MMIALFVCVFNVGGFFESLSPTKHIENDVEHAAPHYHAVTTYCLLDSLLSSFSQKNSYAIKPLSF